MLADPKGSVYHGYHKNGCVNPGDSGVYQTEGVGEDRLTKCMDFNFVDDSVQYEDKDSFGMVRELARTEGIFGGLSSGGNLFAVRELIKKLNGPARIVTLIQDHGAKYVSKHVDCKF